MKETVPDLESRLLLAKALFKKGDSLPDSAARIQHYWNIAEKIVGLSPDARQTDVLKFADSYLLLVPHEKREKILRFPAVERLIHLSSPLSYSENLSDCGISSAGFQKARSGLNRFRGHMGGSAVLSLEGLKAVFVYLPLFANLCRKKREQKWVLDAAPLVEKLARIIVEGLFCVCEEKISNEREEQ